MLSLVLSLLVYVLTCYLLRDVIRLRSIDEIFVFKILILTLISWAPIWIFNITKRIVDPTDFERVMRTARQSMPIHESPNIPAGKIRLRIE